MTDLFKDIVPFEKQNKNYKGVRDHLGYSPAQQALNEVFNSLPAIDKDFVKQFQTIGFDARIWELTLLAVFQEQKFQLERLHETTRF